MNSDTADRILDCAETLMIERGYNAFSYADVSAVVKVSKASIHFHFATKALLVRSVLARYREGVRQGLRQLDQKPSAIERLQAYVGYWEKCIRSNTTPFCICALLASEIPTLPDEIRTEVSGHFLELGTWLKATLQAGAAAGELRLEHDAELEAQMLLASVHGAMLATRAGASVETFANVVASAIARLKRARKH